MVLGMFAIIIIGLTVLSILDKRNQGNFDNKLDELKTASGCNRFCRVDPFGKSPDSLI